MVPDPALVTVDEIAHRQQVDPARGLTRAEAARRLAAHGPNELVGSDRPPLWRRVLAQLRDPLVYLLLVAIVVATAAWWIEGAHGAPVDALVIAAIVLANAVIGLVQEGKAADAVAALADMTAAHSRVLRDGEVVDVPSSELVPGDVLVLAEGDAVGADGHLLQAAALQIQEASLTGESVPVLKDPAPLPEGTAIGDRADMVFKGTAVASGTGRAIVTATGMGTEVGTIATLLDETASEPSPLDAEITRVSKMLGVLVLAIAVVVMAALAIIQGV